MISRWMLHKRLPGRLARALLLVWLACPPAPAAAQDSGEPSGTSAGSSATDGFGADPRARAAYQMIQDAKYVNAREAAAQILAESPESYEGHTLLGLVLHHGEANLPLALYHFKRARALFERKHGAKPPDEGPWLWHATALYELASVAGEMGLHEEKLRYLEARDSHYFPKVPADRGWPLMRLRRYAEAREAVEAGLASDEPSQVSQARTTLCAIESELQRRAEAYQACMAAVEYDRETDQAGPHDFTNAAGAAMSLLKMDEAETLLLEGTEYFIDTTAANPWGALMGLYLLEGRTAEALEATREMLSWQASQQAVMDEQTRSATALDSALFLLVTGHAAEAASLTERTMRRPDRTGFTSAESERIDAAAALLASAANRVAAERRAEEASWLPFVPALRARVEAQRHRFRAWRNARRAASLLNQDRLLNTLRPYVVGGIAVPEWMEGELCAALGPGIVAAGLAEARKLEDFSGVEPYFDAYEAEIALLQGRHEAALGRVEQALESLPGSEALLRARMAALGAHAALELGEAGRAVELFDRALQLNPGVLRWLGATLPCAFEADGGEVPSIALGLLHRSPRFAEGRGFTIRVEGDDQAGRACLSGPRGELLACSSATPRAGEDAAATARRLVADLHEQAFAPRVDLTQSDLTSLDGSTSSGSTRSAKRLQGIFDILTGGAGEEEEEDEEQDGE